MLGPVNASLGGIGYIYPYAGHFGPYNYFEFTGTLGYDFGIAALNVPEEDGLHVCD